MSSVFLSHNSIDRPFVRMLAERLSNDGILVWLDEAEINIGDSLIERISSGIEEMDFVAAIISQNSITSPWVQKEISLAMNKEIKGKKVAVLPILIDNSKLPASIADKLYADFTDPTKFDDSYQNLIRAIKNHRLKNKPVEPKEAKTDKPIQKTILEAFNDITIVGADKQRTQISRPGTKLYNVYLELSEQPSRKWIELFNSERDFPRHSMWRNARINDKYIIIECPLNELEQYHLRDLKEDVMKSNSKYRGILFQEMQSAARLAQEIKKQKEEKDSYLDNLSL
ncbi:TIR domain protein [Leptospira yanagawae serovar Saopaulo str. Sao Paulo = ATCC 700523]|uniref:TIR domain protein n=1 Tax=Leptospira yanagawae serovar Saopaulo str. Sao Paulo = ATCC 700523 TaxID=1249483 RepID=A0A5E8HJP9_9LEPT|nr:toll/interleukin-1 receptor domain-containing protein [Leptospira yanagawae]EOQ90720.1 TIR domain protein [Leptospira yanagawae serovar Saopaulo str. Sao Paulo = ATCC 700523]